MLTSNAAKTNLVKITAVAVTGLCLVVSACNKKGEETTASGTEYSGQFPSTSASAESDLGANPPSAVADSQLPGVQPAYSSAAAS